MTLAIMLWSLTACTERTTSKPDAGLVMPFDCFDVEAQPLGEQVVGYCSKSTDTNLDGSFEIRTYYTYEGDRLASVSFGDPDAPPQETWTYDDLGNLLDYSAYEPDGETLRRHEIYAYDSVGNLLSFAEDSDGDGQRDRQETSSYDCFEVVEMPEKRPGPCLVVFDIDGDGEADGMTSFEWDDNGRLSHERSLELESGEVVERAYSYNEQGNLLAIDIDVDGDGIANSRLGSDYDHDGELTREWFDANADGNTEVSTEYERDEAGNITEEAYFRKDALTRQVTFERDPTSNTVRETSVNYESEPQTRVVVSRFDDAGNIVAKAIDDGGNGRFDTCERYQYNCWR